jgi:carbon storage regulator CsrA
MLVLSRKVGERIHVGDNIVLEIRRIAGNRVTLALDAPRNVRILRGELDGPAREFRAPHEEIHEIQSESNHAAVSPAGVGIIHTLPAEHVGHVV